MTSWRPGADQLALRARAELTGNIRAFFAKRDVLEVETPLLAPACAVEPHVEPLPASHPDPALADDSGCLATSPELFMKRLLASGSGPIFQLCKAFRRDEAGRLHNPEFSLLEWYRPGFDQHALMDEIRDLVRHCLGDPALGERRISYRDLFVTQLGVDPLAADVAQLAEVAAALELPVTQGFETASRENWFDLLLSSAIEPRLRDEGLVFVHDYPAAQASLARLDPDDPRVARRFELYLHGIELANGFEELTQADEQRQRFVDANAARQRLGLSPLPIDEAFLAALAAGLPECSGVALGVDRLLMHLLERSDIDQVLAFSVRRL